MSNAEPGRSRPRESAYLNTLLWTFDRLSVAVGSPEGMTAKEQIATMREIGRVLTGQPSRAATYVPEEWDESAKVRKKGAAPR